MDSRQIQRLVANMGAVDAAVRRLPAWRTAWFALTQACTAMPGDTTAERLANLRKSGPGLEWHPARQAAGWCAHYAERAARTGSHDDAVVALGYAARLTGPAPLLRFLGRRARPTDPAERLEFDLLAAGWRGQPDELAAAVEALAAAGGEATEIAVALAGDWESPWEALAPAAVALAAA